MPITRPRSITEQIDQILRQRIHSGKYPPGSRLPPESELLQEFDVSRATIRTALTRLATEGLILRRQGDGTYVNERVKDINTELGGAWDYVRLIERSGFRPTIELISKIARPARPAEAAALLIEPEREILYIERLFRADDHPIILATNVIALPQTKPVDVEAIDGRLPIAQLMEQHFRQRIAYAIMNIQSTLAGAEIGAVLDRRRQDSLLKITTTFFNRDNEPLVFGSGHLDDRRLSLRLMQTWA